MYPGLLWPRELRSISGSTRYRRHRNLRIVAGGALGMLLLIVGATVAHTQLGLAADRVFTVVGSLVLATAHFYNSYRKKLANSSL